MSVQNCYYCGAEIYVGGRQKDPDTATRDHVTPLSRGGTNSKDNLVWACKSCNQEKGASTLEEYRARLIQRRGVSALSFPGEKKNTCCPQCGGAMARTAYRTCVFGTRPAETGQRLTAWVCDTCEIICTE